MEQREGEADAQGPEARKKRRQPLVTVRGLGRRSRMTGEGAGMQMVKAGSKRKGPSEGINLGADMDLGAGQGQKRGGGG